MCARRLMNRLGVTRLDYAVGIRFARSLSRPFRTLAGPELARDLVRVWQHWQALGMEPGLAEVLTYGLYQALTGRPIGGADAEQ